MAEVESGTSVGAAMEELYSGDAADFVTARNRLSKSLRAGGDREGAERVASLRRPSKLAAIFNQLARHEGDAVANVLTQAEALRVSQLALLNRGDRQDFKKHQTDFRSALDQLSDRLPADVVESYGVRVLAEIEQRVFDEDHLQQLFSGTISSPDDVPAGSSLDAYSDMIPADRESTSSREDRKTAELAAEQERQRLDLAVRKAEDILEKAQNNYERARKQLTDAKASLDDARAARRHA